MKTMMVAVDVRSAHNIGSLLRTCDGFGADALLVGICPYPMLQDDKRLPHIAARAHKEIAKTALGAERTVNWRYVASFSEAVLLLRHEGYRIVAIEQHDRSKRLPELTMPEDTAFIVGREVEGLTEHEIELCDDTYEIPMVGQKESFNVTIAAGIVLYQAMLCTTD